MTLFKKTTRRIWIGGDVFIHCHFTGEGRTVLMIPSLGRDADELDTLSEVLAEAGFSAVAVSPRGTGESVGPLQGLTLHSFATDIASVITNLNTGPVHLLGRSFGNRIARCLAADRPDLVRSLVLLAAGGKFRTGHNNVPIFRRDWIPPFLMRNAGNLTHRQSAAQLEADRATPLEDWWTGGLAPMLIIQGLLDRIAPPANGRVLRHELGQRVRLLEIPDQGHYVSGPIVYDGIIQFLREQDMITSL